MARFTRLIMCSGFRICVRDLAVSSCSCLSLYDGCCVRVRGELVLVLSCAVLEHSFSARPPTHRSALNGCFACFGGARSTLN